MKLPFPLAVLVALVLWSASALAAEPSWPEPILELEKMAWRDPRPGSAWLQLRNYALENGVYAALRERWESRVAAQADAAGCILLGWLDVYDGKIADARRNFESATKMAPQNAAAWQALAEVQLRAGEAQGEASARRAAEAAASDADRVAALRLPGLVAQERGELAAAWAYWKKLEAEALAPTVRVSLIPDFARAHLALGEVDAWGAALAAKAGESADATAVYAAACLALNDSALAHRVARQGLAKDATHKDLRALAISAALACGEAGDAVQRVEAGLGDAPSDDDLLRALEIYADSEARDQILRLFRRHAARLGPIAMRWHERLPAFWRLALTTDLRPLLAAQAGESWEAQLALAELAILEEDTPAATELCWRVLGREYDGQESVSVTRALGNSATIAQDALPVPESGLGWRMSGLEDVIQDKPSIFRPKDTTSVYRVFSLRDGRDLALACLKVMASRDGPAATREFLARLRTAARAWGPGERMLAFTVAGYPAGMLEAAETAIAQQPMPRALNTFTRSRLATVKAMPEISGELVARAEALAAKLPKDPGLPPGQPSGQARWQTRLAACWELFDQGNFAEANREFDECLKSFAADGHGPKPTSWASFHLATLNGVGAFFEDKEKQAEAWAVALRWLALQSPRSTDWPTSPQPRLLWARVEPPMQFTPMFHSNRSQRNLITGAPFGRYYLQSIGGCFPDNQRPGLLFATLHLGENEAADAKMALQGKDLPPESARLMIVAAQVRRIFAGTGNASPEVRKLFDTPDGPIARLLATFSSLQKQQQDKGNAAGFKDDLTGMAPTSPIGRTGWLVAQLHIGSQTSPEADARALAEELVKAPLESIDYLGAKAALERFAKRAPKLSADYTAIAAKITLARLREQPREPMPDEARERLQSLIDAAEIDQATELAKRVLSWPPAFVERWPKATNAQKEAVATLDACGELQGWFSGLRKATAGGTAQDWQRLAEVGTLILQSLDDQKEKAADEPAQPLKKPDRVAAALRKDAEEALREARTTLVRLEPEQARNWTRLIELFGQDPKALTASAPQDVETLLRGAAGGLEVEKAVLFLGNEPAKFAPLLDRWPAEKTLNNNAVAPQVAGVSLARRMWQSGRAEDARRWLDKLAKAHDLGASSAQDLRDLLLEMQAARGERAAMASVLARALRSAAETSDVVEPLPQDSFGNSYPRKSALRPLLEQAERLGLNQEMLTALDREGGPQAADLKIFFLVQKRDPAVLPGLTERLHTPISPQMLAELPAMLAPWEEARAQAQTALRALLPARQLLPRNERIEQVARDGLLAAVCGMNAEAKNLLNSVFAAQHDARVNRPAVLCDIVEGLTLCTTPEEAQPAAEEWAQLAVGSQYSQEPFSRALIELATRKRDVAFHLLLTALTAARPPANRNYASVIDDATHVLAARLGDWSSFTPFVWMQGPDKDGTAAEVCSALVWPSTGKNGKDRIFKSVPAEMIATPKNLRLELFFGPTTDRMTSVSVADAVDPKNDRRSVVPHNRGYLMASATIEGKTVLGPPQPFGPEKNLVPSIEALLTLWQSPLWMRVEGGPANLTLRGARVGRSRDDAAALASAEVELPEAAGKDLNLSGWIRGGYVNLVLERPDGARQSLAQKLGLCDGEVWSRFETTLKSGAPGAQGKVFLQFAPGSDYSGIRATVMEKKPAVNPG